MTNIQMKCAICGNEWEFSEGQYKLRPFKICYNCILIGPHEPAHYTIPKGKLVSSFLRDRESIIVSEDEMRKLYQEYYQQTEEHYRKMNEELKKSGYKSTIKKSYTESE